MKRIILILVASLLIYGCSVYPDWDIETAKQNIVSKINIESYSTVTYMSCDDISIESDYGGAACDTEKCCAFYNHEWVASRAECCFVGDE